VCLRPPFPILRNYPLRFRELLARLMCMFGYRVDLMTPWLPCGVVLHVAGDTSSQRSWENNVLLPFSYIRLCQGLLRGAESTRAAQCTCRYSEVLAFSERQTLGCITLQWSKVHISFEVCFRQEDVLVNVEVRRSVPPVSAVFVLTSHQSPTCLFQISKIATDISNLSYTFI